MTTTPAILSVYQLAPEYATFRFDAALDPDLSDAARGLLWRVLAMSKKHGPTWQIWLSTLIETCPHGESFVKSCLSELRGRGYVRRQKLRRDDGTFYWSTEACEVAIFEDDSIRSEYLTGVWTTPPPEVPTEPKKETKPRKKKESTAKPGYRAIMDWWTGPIAVGGRGIVLASSQYSRAGKEVNTLCEIAAKRGWVSEDDTKQALLIDILNDLCAWIEEGSPYRGQINLHNLGEKIQPWYDSEGYKVFGEEGSEELVGVPSYMPRMTR